LEFSAHRGTAFVSTLWFNAVMPQTQLLLFPPPQPLVDRFGRDFFRSVPEKPGVYFLCSEEAGVLYVGKAKNLRKRLSSYRSAHPERLPRRVFRLLFRVTRIYWDECLDEAAAIARERQLLLVLQPRFNAAGRYPPPRRVLIPPQHLAP
jgi:excinuclease ABC subunit C